MTLTIDASSREPIYHQIVAAIKLQIATGQLAPGDQLPTVRSLAQDLRVNFNTVARAYSILDEAGIISTQRGRGTYVRQRPEVHAAEALRAERLGVIVGGAVLEALSLGYGEEEVGAAVEAALQRLRGSQWQQEV